jgi:hypothetical protein
LNCSSVARAVVIVVAFVVVLSVDGNREGLNDGIDISNVLCCRCGDEFFGSDILSLICVIDFSTYSLLSRLLLM